MITVCYKGRLGNQLFEYALGRVLAEDMNYQLSAGAIGGFPATADSIPGKRINSSMMFKEQIIDIDKARSIQGKLGIILSGWFQRYEYYKPHKERIRQWFNRGWNPINLKSSDVVVHVRRPQGPVDNLFKYKIGNDKITVNGRGNIIFDDVVKSHLVRLGISGTDILAQTDLVPFEWYEQILDGMEDLGKVYIASDMTADPFLDYFAKYSPEILRGSMLEDFDVMRSANRIVTCMSTYSWWAAFLSNAREVYMPVVNYGSWSNPEDVNLTVDDDNRYHCVEAKLEGRFF